MNAKRTSKDGSMDTSSEKTVEDLVRASAEAMEQVMKGEWTKDSNGTANPIHPLMAHPTAMMAAATVVGMGVTSQIAGMWLGFMKGMSEAGEKAGEPRSKAPESVDEASTAKPASKSVQAKADVKKPLRVVVDNAKKPAAADKVAETSAVDDLKMISGIGPKLVEVLAEKGLNTFADIATMSAKQAAALDAELGLDGRVERDDWVGQAKALMGDAS